MSPFGFGISGNFIERNLIGQWEQCKWRTLLARERLYRPVATV